MKKNNWIILALTLVQATIANSAILSGSVKDQNGDPVLNGEVVIYNSLSNIVDQQLVDPAGGFLSLLADGSYYIFTRNTGLLDDVWDGVGGTPCMYEFCGVVATGTAIIISGGVDVTGIDFILDPIVGATISGNVQDGGANTYSNVHVLVYHGSGGYVTQVATDNTGNYQTPILANGDYYLRTNNEPNGYANEFYNNKQCTVNCNDPAVVITNDAVAINSADVMSIDFVMSLPPGNTISGQVTDDVLLTGIDLANIDLYDNVGNPLKNTSTNQTGQYYFTGLADGDYKVLVSNTLDHAEELYNNIPCNGFCDVIALGDVISLAASDSLNVDFALTYNGQGRIVGTVTRSDTMLPVNNLQPVDLYLYDSSGGLFPMQQATTDSNGLFEFENISGDYYLTTANGGMPHGLINEAWDNIQCTGECGDPLNVVGATLITVNPNSTSIANFELDPTPSISGTVIAQNGSLPLSNIQVCVARRDSIPIGCDSTDINGDYSVGNLPSESDLVAYVNDTGGQSYSLQTYLNQGPSDFVNGTGIDVSTTDAININFSLESPQYISGIIKDELDNPIGAGQINIWDSMGNIIANGSNDGSGNYQAGPLPNGTYFATALGEPWSRVSQLWQNISCPQEYCDLTNTGTPIVLSGAGAANVDFNIIPQNAVATISGSLKDQNGDPAFGNIRLYDPSGNYIDEVNTDGLGNFTSNLLNDGSYFAVTKYSNQLFDDVWDGVDGTQCMYELCGVVATGTAIVISGGVSVVGIDFILDPLVGGTISGHAQDSSNNPVGNLSINIYASNGQQVIGWGTDNNGDYQTSVIPDGNYYLATTNEPLGLGTQFYNGINCFSNCFDPANILASTPVTISGSNITGIDFTLSLPPGNVISGNISDDVLMTNIFGVGMTLRNEFGGIIKYSNADQMGNYYFSGLADGNYKVQVSSAQDHAEELYDNIPCVGGACDFTNQGTVITVSANNAPNTDFALTYNGSGRILGNVTRTDSGLPVSGQVNYFSVILFDSLGNQIDSRNPDTMGNYSFPITTSGDYYLVTQHDVNTFGLVNEYWDNIQCTTNCFDPLGNGATPITVNSGDTIIADFALDPTPSISGTVTAQNGNSSLQNILVCVARRDGSNQFCNATDVNGDYSVKGLTAEADLIVYINQTNGQPYVLETYLNKGPFDFVNATGVDISVSNATGIDFQLEYAHYILGVIKDESDTPIGEGQVNIWDMSGNIVTTGGNDGSGNYLVGPLPSGTYFATAEGEPWGRVSQLWQNISCPQEYCDLTNTGTPIVLNGTDAMNVDFNIIPQNAIATISGTLKDQNGDPVSGSIRFYDPYGNYVTQAGTDGNGGFTTTMLPDGSYFAITKYTNLLFDDVWDGVDGTQCMYELCGVVATGTAIVISGGVSVTGIDFILDPLIGGTISGHIQDSSNNALSNTRYVVFASNGQSIYGFLTDLNGNYQTPLLANGTFYVRTTNEPFGLGRQFYNGINCLTNCDDPTTVTSSSPVVINNNNVMSVDFTLSIPPGNIISGHLSDEGFPLLNIKNANMYLFDSAGNYLKNTITDNLGNYYLSGLADGDYKVQVLNAQNYVEELYDNISCAGGSCDRSIEGAVINVSGSDVPNIDFALTYNGTPRITGVVSALNGGALLENIEVCVATRSGSTQRCTNTNANGVYSLENIASSTDLIPYIRSTNGQAYLRENYIDQAYQDWPNSTGVDVSVNSMADVNFQLEDGYFVSGLIRDAVTSNPLDSIYVSILDSNGSNTLVSGLSGTNGMYQTSVALPAGANYVARVYSTGYIPQMWNNVDCFGGCNNSLADLIILGPINATSIDFDLNVGSSISGVILDSVTNNPIEGVTVSIQNLDGSFYKSVATDASGIYSHENLPVEDYYLIANISTHFTQMYQNVDCLLGCNLAQDGSSVSIPNLTTDVPNIDFSLNTGGSINGVVTDTSTGDPIVGAQVTVFFESGNYINAATTDASGNYSIGGLVEGSYYLETQTDTDMHLDTWYGGDVCQLRNKCIPNNSGNPVLISGLNATVNNVDFSLGIGGGITGQILLEDGNQWLGITVGSGSLRAEIWDENRNLLRFGFQYSPYLDSYEVLGLAPGIYYVVFNSTTRNNDITYPSRVDQALIDTAYGGLPCPRGSCDHTLTIPVQVNAGETLTGVDGALPWGPIVKGTLADTVGDPVSTSASVYLHSETGNYAAFGRVDSNGDWKLQTGLPSGTYYLSTFGHGRINAGLNSSGNINFVDELYDDIECAGGCEVTLGDPITMVSSVVTGLNMQVDIGGQISGNVSGVIGGLPLVTVTAYDSVGNKVIKAITNLTGDYTISALPVGDYYVVTNNTSGLLDEVYDDILCEPFCNPTIGTSISIGSIGATVSTIDFVLDAAGSISGLARDSGGALIAGIQVEVYNAIGVSVGSVISDVNGVFDMQNLPSGDYHVRTRNSINQVDALYQGMTCLGDACDVTTGTIVSVTSGMATTNIDLQLQAELSLGGILTDEISTMPIVGTTIALYDAAGDFVANAVTDINGSYVFNGLLAGNYYVVTRNTPNYIDEAYNDIICNASCLASTGSIITLTSSRSDIDIQLSQGVSVFGQVVNNSNGVIGVRVQVFDGSGNQYSEGLTDIDGNFIIPQIPDGQYFIRTSNDTGFIDQVHSGFTCEGFCDVITGTPIDVTGSAVNVDFNLEAGGVISGNINDGINGVSSIPLEVYDTFENLIGTAVTDAIGDYRVSGLTPGSYAVKSVANNGYINQIYNNQTCAPEPCILVNSNLITVNTSEVMGIDFILKFGQSFNGTATDVFNNPLPLGTAVLYDSVDTPEIVMETPIVAGNWQFNGVANGNYYLLILNGSGLIDELYSEVGCPSGSCDIASLGTQISLTSAPVTQKNHVELKYASIELESIKAANGFDIVLDSGVDIFGTVQKNTSSPVAVDGATVFIMDTSGKVAGTGTSNALGEYESDASFPGGDYLVTALTDNQNGVNQGLIHELYDDIPCPLDCDLSSGNIVTFMASDPDQEINFILDSGSSISGTATVQGTNEALVSATIKLYDSSGMLVGQTQTGFDGSYQISGFSDGTYYAIILPISSLHEDTLYGGLVCEQSCNVSTGTAIVLGVKELKTGIDFSLSIKEVIFASGFE